MNGDQATLERDLGYAKRINLNSTRIWLRGWDRSLRKTASFISRQDQKLVPFLYAVNQRRIEFFQARDAVQMVD